MPRVHLPVATTNNFALPLQSFSTSPHCEPANFVEKLKKRFEFLAENQNIMQKFFPQGMPRRFKPANNGNWCLVENS